MKDKRKHKILNRYSQELNFEILKSRYACIDIFLSEIRTFYFSNVPGRLLVRIIGKWYFLENIIF